MLDIHEAYIVSILGGSLVTFIWTELLHLSIKKYADSATQPPKRIAWIPILVGMFERALYTTVVLYSVPGAASLIGSWITIKAVGGWATFSKDMTLFGRCLFSVGLLGSAMSALIAVAAALAAKVN